MSASLEVLEPHVRGTGQKPWTFGVTGLDSEGNNNQDEVEIRFPSSNTTTCENTHVQAHPEKTLVIQAIPSGPGMPLREESPTSD